MLLERFFYGLGAGEDWVLSHKWELISYNSVTPALDKNGSQGYIFSITVSNQDVADLWNNY